MRGLCDTARDGGRPSGPCSSFAVSLRASAPIAAAASSGFRLSSRSRIAIVSGSRVMRKPVTSSRRMSSIPLTAVASNGSPVAAASYATEQKTSHNRWAAKTRRPPRRDFGVSLTVPKKWTRVPTPAVAAMARYVFTSPLPATARCHFLAPASDAIAIANPFRPQSPPTDSSRATRSQKAEVAPERPGAWLVVQA